MKKQIILSNMGGARSPEELKYFLKNMFSDQRIMPGIWRYLIPQILPHFRYKKVWKNYEKIGGSHIYSITERLVNKMQKNSENKIDFSMRYTRPHLNDVVNEKNVLIIAMYPHFSDTTVRSLIDETEKLKSHSHISIIHSYYKNKDFNTILVNSIKNQVPNIEEYHLIFSAHGLPKYITKKGDPYVQQIKEHIEILKPELQEFQSISLGFQSRLGPVKWERPYLENVIKKYSGKKVIIYPISFLIDNSETDFELKIEYAEIARQNKIKEYKVLNCLNDSDEFSKFLLKLSDISI